MQDTLFNEVKFKKLTVENVDFKKADFFKTPLKGIDFSTCNIEGITFSDSFKELSGIKISPAQAVDIVRILDIKVV